MSRDDPVVERVRAARRAIAEECGNDLHRLYGWAENPFHSLLSTPIDRPWQIANPIGCESCEVHADMGFSIQRSRQHPMWPKHKRTARMMQTA